jgi:hypothetical protein
MNSIVDRSAFNQTVLNSLSPIHSLFTQKNRREQNKKRKKFKGIKGKSDESSLPERLDTERWTHLHQELEQADNDISILNLFYFHLVIIESDR